jgi:hypothetical protein
MELELNSKTRQNKLLGIVSSFKFRDFAAEEHGDHILSLENLTSGISNSIHMIPQEYRSDSHTKSFLRQACLGELWASNVLAMASAQTEMSFTCMVHLLDSGLQRFEEEKANITILPNQLQSSMRDLSLRTIKNIIENENLLEQRRDQVCKPDAAVVAARSIDYATDFAKVRTSQSS